MTYTFLLALNVLTYGLIVAFASSYRRGLDWRVHILQAAALAGLTGGVLAGFLPSGRPAAFNWAVPLFAAGAMIAVSAAALAIRRALILQPGRRAFALTLNGGLVVAALYIVGACVDHWRFVAGRGEMGIAAAQLLGADDVQCDNIVLIRMQQDFVEYRCPTSVVWGGTFVHWPFMPWPDYTTGRSVALKQAIERTMDEAERLEPPETP